MPVHDISPPPGRPGARAFELWSADAVAPATAPHRHRFFEIVYVRTGTGTHVIEFEPQPIRAPTCYFIAPGQVHYWEGASGIDGRWLLFGEDFLLGGGDDHRARGDRDLFAALSASPGVVLDRDAARRLAGLIDAIDREHQARQSQHESVIRAYLHVLLVTCARRRDTRPSAGGRPPELAREFTGLVAERVLAMRSVADYADAMGVTAGHLADTVKAVTGRTPSEIIRGQLVLEAKRLLAHTKLSVSEVGHRLAFEDPAYFCRFFRREVGASPGAFRRGLIADG